MKDHALAVSKSGESGTERLSRRRILTPVTDIIESEENIVVRSELPGVDEKAIEITLEGDTLSIRGAVTAPDTGRRKALYAEAPPCDFERSFVLLKEVDREKISARAEHGVLEITLPKGTFARAKRIEVKH